MVLSSFARDGSEGVFQFDIRAAIVPCSEKDLSLAQALIFIRNKVTTGGHDGEDATDE